MCETYIHTYMYNLLSPQKGFEFPSWETGIGYRHEKNLELLNKAIELDNSATLHVPQRPLPYT